MSRLSRRQNAYDRINASQIDSQHAGGQPNADSPEYIDRLKQELKESASFCFGTDSVDSPKVAVTDAAVMAAFAEAATSRRKIDEEWISRCAWKASTGSKDELT